MYLIVTIIVGCVQTPEVTAPEPGAPVAEFPKMVVGDTWRYKANDWFTHSYVEHIESVSEVFPDGGYVTIVDVPKTGRRTKLVYDYEKKWIESIDLTTNKKNKIPDPPKRVYHFPLWVGKKWEDGRYKSKHIKSQKWYEYRNSYTVVAYEEVKTKIGKIWAFKIKRVNINLTAGNTGYSNYWYAPKIKFPVKYFVSWEYRYKLLEYIPGQ